MSVRLPPDPPQDPQDDQHDPQLDRQLDRPFDGQPDGELDDLIDHLGQDEPADPATDTGDTGEVERMLTAWRAAMPTAGPTDERLLDAVTAAVARPSSPRRAVRVTAGVAGAVLLVTVGVTAAAAHAGPDSPLWPITQLVYAGLAESRASADSADDALREAKIAVDQGRYPDAARHLDRADDLTDKVDEQPAADRLRQDIATVRALLRNGTEPRSRADASAPATPATPPAATPTNHPASASTTPPDLPRAVEHTPPADSAQPPQPADPGATQPDRGQPPTHPRTNLPAPHPTGLDDHAGPQPR